MHTTRRLQQTLGSTSAFQVQAYLSETPDYSIAQSVDGVVGITWNRHPTERPNGFPHTYSHQQWFMLPEPVARMILGAAEIFDEQQ